MALYLTAEQRVRVIARLRLRYLVTVKYSIRTVVSRKQYSSLKHLMITTKAFLSDHRASALLRLKMKQRCKQCSTEKDLDMYPKSKKYKSGRAVTCKKCNADSVKSVGFNRHELAVIGLYKKLFTMWPQ